MVLPLWRETCCATQLLFWQSFMLIFSLCATWGKLFGLCEYHFKLCYVFFHYLRMFCDEILFHILTDKDFTI